MPSISMITNASDRRLTVSPPEGESFDVAAFSQHRCSPPIQLPETTDSLRFVFDGGGLVHTQMNLFQVDAQIQVNYPDNPTPWSLPDLSPVSNSNHNLFFLVRPTTDFTANTSTQAIWVIGDVDTGGDQ